MILLGRDLSPFTRRCATLLNLLEVSYERKIVNTADDAKYIRRFNPLGRIPALVLGEEVVIDSAAIVDYVLELADSDHALLPGSGAARRAVLLHSALAVGVMEKAVTFAYELIRRPTEFVYEPYRDQIKAQLVVGLTHLQETMPDTDWYGGARANLADVNVVVAFDHVGIVAPDVVNDPGLAQLSAYAARANQHPAFSGTKWRG